LATIKFSFECKNILIPVWRVSVLSGEDIVAKKIEEFGGSISERTTALANGIIFGFLPFLLKLLLAPKGFISSSSIIEVFLITIFAVGLGIWALRVFWRGKHYILYFLVGGLASSLSASVFLYDAWYIGTYLVSFFLGYIVTLIEWRLTIK
jgi:hypothetical protein